MGILDTLFGGGNAGKKEAKEANQILRDNIARLERIGIPTVEAQKIALSDPELVGLLEAEQLGSSALEAIQQDPRLRQSALRSLAGIEELAKTGLGAEDKLALDQILRQSSAQAQAQKESILQNAASQGTLDSGNALIAQLQAGQAAADRQSQQGLQVAANAAAARRAALLSQGDMASRLSQQDLGVKTQAASARDAINQFNAQNRQNVAASNLAARQGISNQKTANRNQEEIANKSLIQQNFQNQIQKAGGVANASNALASNLQNQAQAAQAAEQAQRGAIIGAATNIGIAGLKGGLFSGSKAAPQTGGLGTEIEPGSMDEYYMKQGWKK